MEKEKVLEIEIKKINNEYSAFYPIKMDIDKLTEISDGKILGDGEYIPYIEFKISGYCYKIYLTDTEVFPRVIKNNCIEELKQRIDEINEKYGIPKRWRAEKGKKYYFLNTECEIRNIWGDKTKEDETRYNLGNYFKTEEEAQKVKEELDKFWAKVRAGEIGGDE